MFGRATITLGIGPHYSSFLCSVFGSTRVLSSVSTVLAGPEIAEFHYAILVADSAEAGRSSA